MNSKYATKVKEEIDKLLQVGFIYLVQKTEWLSPVVIVPKKNGKLRLCVDFWILNSVTKMDPFPLPFTDRVLEEVAGYEIYSTLDGFSGYNQVLMAINDELKTCFITEWGHLLTA